MSYIDPHTAVMIPIQLYPDFLSNSQCFAVNNNNNNNDRENNTLNSNNNSDNPFECGVFLESPIHEEYHPYSSPSTSTGSFDMNPSSPFLFSSQEEDSWFGHSDILTPPFNPYVSTSTTSLTESFDDNNCHFPSLKETPSSPFSLSCTSSLSSTPSSSPMFNPYSPSPNNMIENQGNSSDFQTSPSPFSFSLSSSLTTPPLFPLFSLFEHPSLPSFQQTCLSPQQETKTFNNNQKPAFIFSSTTTSETSNLTPLPHTQMSSSCIDKKEPKEAKEEKQIHGMKRKLENEKNERQGPAQISTNQQNAVLTSSSSSSPSLPPISNGCPFFRNTGDPTQKCLLCTKSKPSQCVSWSFITHVTLFTLHSHFPNVPFFSFNDFIYPFILNHWSVWEMEHEKNTNWKRMVQVIYCVHALSHSDIYERTPKHKKNWRMAKMIDPWKSEGLNSHRRGKK